MNESYGNNWGNNFGHAPNEEWTVQLEGKSEWKIAEALKMCFCRPTAWPPMLGEFIALLGSVSSFSNPEVQQVPQIYDQYDGPGKKAFLAVTKSGFELGDPVRMKFFKIMFKIYSGKIN